jgi:hypothetical protein
MNECCDTTLMLISNQTVTEGLWQSMA